MRLSNNVKVLSLSTKKGKNMNESNILTGNAAIKQIQSKILFNIRGFTNTKGQLLNNMNIKQFQREIFLYTKGQYMRESNILSDNATIKLLQRSILLNTKGQYMKESDIRAGNATNS